jgi:hypothetical protein
MIVCCLVTPDGDPKYIVHLDWGYVSCFVCIAIKLLVDIILLCCFMFGLLFMYGIRTPGKLGGSGRLREVLLVCTLPPLLSTSPPF